MPRQLIAIVLGKLTRADGDNRYATLGGLTERP